MDITKLQNQDRNEFKLMVQDHQDLVYNTVLSFVRNIEDAEDICQEVFVDAFHGLPKFKGESSLKTWLYRLSVNAAMGYLRKQNRQKRAQFLTSLFAIEEREDISDFVHPGVQLENQERAIILDKAIAKLPDKQMIAYRLRSFEDLDYETIAKVMETSLSSVESLLHRAKQNLQKHLRIYYTHNMID